MPSGSAIDNSERLAIGGCRGHAHVYFIGVEGYAFYSGAHWTHGFLRLHRSWCTGSSPSPGIAIYRFAEHLISAANADDRCASRVLPQHPTIESRIAQPLQVACGVLRARKNH